MDEGGGLIGVDCAWVCLRVEISIWALFAGSF